MAKATATEAQPKGIRYRVLENLQHDGILFLPGDPAPPTLSREALDRLIELGVIGLAPDIAV